MRQFVPMTIFAVGVATALSTVSVPAQAQYAQAQFAHCVPSRGCVNTTQAKYNACYQLGRERGWSDQDNSRRNPLQRPFDVFIMDCIKGKIPR